MDKIEPTLPLPTVVVPPSPAVILDSGATATFVTRADAVHLQRTVPITNCPTVLSANGAVMRPTHSGVLPLSPLLSDSAQSAFVLDDLRTGTLVSLSQLCNDGCIAVFSRSDVRLFKNNHLLLTGQRLSNGLWSLPLSATPSLHMANGILRLDRPKHDLARYYHAALGCPVPSTLLRAIRRGHLVTFPGLTTSLITKHLPKSLATTLGHQDQEAKHLRSTSPPVSPTNPPDLDPDLAPDLDTRTHQLCVTLMSTQTLAKSYSDQTGRFPVPSSRGNHYLFILYHYDTNSIHAVAIPNRQAASIRNAWVSTHQLLLQQGHAPNLHILDNECSQSLKDAFHKYNVDYQRVPPKEHRANAAERAIRTFKNHFISVLCTTDSAFPLSEWDRLLPQTVLTLNLLRSSRIHPSLSAHASLFGLFDFNRTPIAPAGTKVVAHLSADARTPFGEHGQLGWYIGPSPEHYRCYRCYFPASLSEKDVLKVDFFPQTVPFPQLSREAYLRQTAEDMLSLLQDGPPHSQNAPLSFGPPILNAYADVASILRRAIPPPIPLAPPPGFSPLPTPPLLPSPVPTPRVLSPTASPASPQVSPTLPLQFLPVPPPRVAPTLPNPAPSPRVSISRVPPTPPLPPSSQASLHALAKLAPPPLPRKSPRARLSRTHFDPRTHQRHLLQSVHVVQALLHDVTPNTSLAASTVPLAGKLFHPTTGKPENIDSLLRGADSAVWLRSLANEWGRCMQGLTQQRSAADKINGTNTMFFILPQQVPAGRKVTYAHFVCTLRPGKSELYRIRMTVGGNLLDAFQDVRSPAVSLLDAKLHFNSVISDAHRGARYCTGDIKDFFLQSLMTIYQYMKVHKKYLPPEIISEYKLTPEHFDSKGYCYVEIRKGMYGLKEAAILAYEQLVAHLKPYGYYPVRQTPGLWRHCTLPTTFTLAVDDFGIKYFSRHDADHLFSALESKYAITKDWTGANYLGFHLDWNYPARYVDVSMPGYVAKALQTLGHTPPSRPQHAPHLWTAPVYGAKTQFASSDLSPLLDLAGIRRVQQIAGTFLYYSRGCDPTIITALNEISGQQAAPTEKTKAACDMLLDYLSTHPNATLRFHASDMVLAVCSDAAYLVLPQARSRASGNFFLTTLPSAVSQPPAPTPNAAVHVLCKTIRSVAASAAEAETGALFLNAQEAVPIVTALHEMGHPQPSSGTPLETDNTTALGILRAQVRLKRSKAFDMRHHWLIDRVQSKQFNLHWKPGGTNSADYFSKHHPPAYHKQMRPNILLDAVHSTSVTSSVRGCVSPSGSLPPGSHSRTT